MVARVAEMRSLVDGFAASADRTAEAGEARSRGRPGLDVLLRDAAIPAGTGHLRQIDAELERKAAGDRAHARF